MIHFKALTSISSRLVSFVKLRSNSRSRDLSLPLSATQAQPSTIINNELADSSAVKIINDLLAAAFVQRASDVHICPGDTAVTVRFRIDGRLRIFDTFPQSVHEALISRLKVLAGLRTDDQQGAQDGRFQAQVLSEIKVDVRISIVPTYYGQNAVLRLLVNRTDVIDLAGLGFSASMTETILKAITRPYGMVLATGPTGSGKTTTLYALTHMLNQPDVSLVTIEDPVEYSVPGINQIQVNPTVGLSFASGLRSLVRQDPDVVMVGEIRDGETARMAVNAALTGHLVLSSFHANDAATTIPRLLDMGIEPYMIASALQVVIGQRLVRRICLECKQARILSDIEAMELAKIIGLNVPANTQVFFGVGCAACNQSGYIGRIAVGEVLVITEEIRSAILSRAPATVIRALAVVSGMVPLMEDAWGKVEAGLTTVDELLYISNI